MTDLAIVRDGVAGIIEALIDHQVHAGVGFTCSEAEGFHDALTELGLDEAAEIFMCSHAETDDVEEGDCHLVTAEWPNGVAAAWARVEAASS